MFVMLNSELFKFVLNKLYIFESQRQREISPTDKFIYSISYW